MNNRISTQKYLLTIYGLYFFIFAFMASSVTGKILSFDRARQLQEKGYSTDTPEQIIEATKSESYYTRYIALELLTQRIGKEAIPTLKESLNDPKIQVRWRAAHWLGTLGDKSGLERMRQDLRELAPNNGAPVPMDPNVTDPNEVKKREGKRNLRLSYALGVARVLAELGDRQGYTLAARMALDGAWGAQRMDAVYGLVEIAKADPNTLAAEGRDPASILCAMADSEKNQTVFSTLTSSVKKLGGDIAVRVLERASVSPHQSDKMRNVAKRSLEKVRAKMKATENKAKDSNNPSN